MASLGALKRARALVGTRFRQQGREVASGLDCIGLVMLAHRIDPLGIADDYRLSGSGRQTELMDEIGRWFRPVSSRAARPGDLVLMSIGRRQLHLGILAERGLVHADLRRGMVVEGPPPEGSLVIGRFRRRRVRRG